MDLLPVEIQRMQNVDIVSRSSCLVMIEVYENTKVKSRTIAVE